MDHNRYPQQYSSFSSVQPQGLQANILGQAGPPHSNTAQLHTQATHHGRGIGHSSGYTETTMSSSSGSMDAIDPIAEDFHDKALNAFDEHQYQLALIFFKRAIKKQPTCAYYHANLANLYQHLNKNEV